MDNKFCITRGSYGEILSQTNHPLYGAAKKLLARAIQSGYLQQPYVDVDKKHRGSALNYDIYDACTSSVLIQRRKTICTKYGNSPTKDYYSIAKRRGNLVVTEVSEYAKPLVVKRCKASHELGEAIELLERSGDIFIPPERCLMVVEVTSNGRYQTPEKGYPIHRTKLTEQDGLRFFGYTERPAIDARTHAIQNAAPEKQLVIIEGSPIGLIRKTDTKAVLSMSAFRFTKEVEQIARVGGEVL